MKIDRQKLGQKDGLAFLLIVDYSAVCRFILATTLHTAMSSLSLVKPLSHLREEKEHVSELLTEGFAIPAAHGAITEISGKSSAGKTAFVLSLLARLSADGGVCAVIDGSDSFDPRTARLAGIELDGILWVRCGGNVEKAFMAADLAVQAKGFGCIWLDLCGLQEQKLRMVPRTYWFRYRTRIKETPTVMLVTTREPLTGSASHRSYQFELESAVWSGSGKFQLLRELRVRTGDKGRPFSEPVSSVIFADHGEPEQSLLLP